MCIFCDTRCCISDEDAKKFEDFKLETYGIKGTNGFVWPSTEGVM